MGRKNFMRALALAVTLITVAGTVPVMAVETETEITTSGATGDVSFELDIADSFNLAIPKSIVLTKNADGNYDADYNIKMVSCDIAPTKQVAVSSNAEIKISREGSEDKKTATNDMDKSVDEIQSKITFADKTKDVTYVGYMNAGVLTSGSWQAQTTFTVALEDKPIIKEAGLYDADGNMLHALTKEQVETDNNNGYVHYSLPEILGVDRTQVAEAVMPEGVTRIGNCAFFNCTNLTSVTIPDSVTEIGRIAFYNCTSLTSVTIPDSVTEIGESTFSGCSSLTSVTIPDSVTTIGLDAFYGCSSLTSVTIPDGVTSIGEGAFKNCSGLTSVTIPASVTEIGESAFYNCISLTSVTIPDSVTSIGDNAFSDCTSLTSVTIPDGVTSIGEDAFYNCTSLTSVTIPDSVTSIGTDAFYYVPHIYYNGTATGQPWGAKTIN